MNCEIRAFAATGTAPLPLSLYACRDVSMQKFVGRRPREDARLVWAGLAPVVEGDGDRAVGPAATDGWNWSVGAPAVELSLTTAGVVQVTPPSVDWVNFTSAWPTTASQSS